MPTRIDLGQVVGPTGPAGPGVPSGGPAESILMKGTAADYDAVWRTPGQARTTLGVYSSQEVDNKVENLITYGTGTPPSSGSPGTIYFQILE